MKFRKLAVALAAISVAAPVQAVEFSKTIFFGDSLTDSGSYGAKFTTNPGKVWAENLAARLGTMALPFLGAGGTDYAQGGARVTQVPGIGFPQVPATPVSQQIDAYLAANAKADPNALYTVWAGANDIFTQAGLAGAGVISAAQAQAGVVQAANDLVAQLQRLKAAGARYIIVPNLPDIGATPFGQGSGAAASFTGFSQLYNATLSAGLKASAISIISLDTYKLIQEVNASPGQFGITNVTSPACTTASSLQCTPATLVNPNAPQTYAFADGVHPTTVSHQILADYAYSFLAAPSQIGMLAETPLASSAAQRRAIDSRMRQPMGNRARGSFEAFADVDYMPVKVDNTSASPGIDTRNKNLSLGGDVQASNTVIVGAALGYSEATNDFGASGGGYKQRLTSIAAYGSWRTGSMSYLNAMASAGSIDYGTIRRNIALGIATRTETGSTSGSHSSFRIGGGMDMASGAWSYGPVANLTWQKVSVDGYSEQSASSTSMAFGSQSRTSLTGSMGGRASYLTQSQMGELRPYAQLTYEHEFRNKGRDVSASVNGMPGSFDLPAYIPDRSYLLLGAGVVAQISKSFSAVLSVNSLLSQRDTRATGVALNLRLHF